jgi:quercetin dioxygenase-like cupin family protein
MLTFNKEESMSDGEGRVFLRGITSEHYGLNKFLKQQRSAPRVRPAGTIVDNATVAHSGDSDQSTTWWMLGPGDNPFLTQNIQIHFVELFPGGSNHGHGHQNEALFYILEGRGYEIHDAKRYDWEKDDLVAVHNDSVHRHFNANSDRRALALVIKAKCTWMYLGLIQQGRSGPVENEETYGPREEWSRLWTPGVQERKKVLKPSDTRWENSRDGRVRVLTSPQRTDFRAFSIDIYQQEVPGGSRTAKHWHMADEALHIISGRGYSLHWDVQAEISEKYYARVTKEPTRWDFSAGDVVYIPQNTIHQHFNADPSEPLVMLSAQNRLFKLLGYDSVVYLEDAPKPSEKELAGAGKK